MIEHKINIKEDTVTITTPDDIFTMTITEAFNYSSKLQSDLIDAICEVKEKNEETK